MAVAPRLWKAWRQDGAAADRPPLHPAMLPPPAPDDLLRLWPVSKAVNTPRNNGAELLVAQPQTPAPGGGPNSA